MSLPKPTKQNSIDSACLSSSVNEVTQVILHLEVSAALPSWQGEASPIPASPSCSTPHELDTQSEGSELGLGALRVLDIADDDEGINVPHAGIEQGQDDEYSETFARVEYTNGPFESVSNEEDDDDELLYQPKGGLSHPTKPKPGGTRPTTAAVGKPAGK